MENNTEILKRAVTSGDEYFCINKLFINDYFKSIMEIARDEGILLYRNPLIGTDYIIISKHVSLPESLMKKLKKIYK